MIRISISEDVDQDAQLFAAIKKQFLHYFPNGWISGGPYIYLVKVIGVKFGLIADHSELPSNIAMNDPMFTNIPIRVMAPDSYETSLQGSISVNPTEKYMAMGTIKTRTANIKGNGAKVLTGFTKLFETMKKMVKDNEQNIYGRNKYSDKYFELI